MHPSTPLGDSGLLARWSAHALLIWLPPRGLLRARPRVELDDESLRVPHSTFPSRVVPFMRTIDIGRFEPRSTAVIARGWRGDVHVLPLGALGAALAIRLAARLELQRVELLARLGRRRAAG